MKTIGLIGGMSWESTAIYYQQINQAVRERLGGLHSAKILLHSCDFAEIAALQQQGCWDLLAEQLARTAQALERAGADCAAICTNTMHKVADEVQAEVRIPLIDIRDAVGAAIQQQGLGVVGLLGTRFTMEQDFYHSFLSRKRGIEVVVPSVDRRDEVHEMIFGRLCRGVVREEDRMRLVAAIDQMAEQGARGVVLGCTELMLLLGQQDCPLPLFDTTTLHAQALVAFALQP